mmetsp:Transcript_40762/g.91499  ORF Transcript_40762/g.91499 Transcript_40762/m.91499 type:complete len:103 (-) Transcript_40762:4-312(-)
MAWMTLLLASLIVATISEESAYQCRNSSIVTCRLKEDSPALASRITGSRSTSRNCQTLLSCGQMLVPRDNTSKTARTFPRCLRDQTRVLCASRLFESYMNCK